MPALHRRQIPSQGRTISVRADSAVLKLNGVIRKGVVHFDILLPIIQRCFLLWDAVINKPPHLNIEKVLKRRGVECGAASGGVRMVQAAFNFART